MGNLCPCFTKEVFKFLELENYYDIDEEKLNKLKPKPKKEKEKEKKLDDEVWVLIQPSY